MTLDQLIQQKAADLTMNQSQLNNLKSTLDDLKTKLKGSGIFKEYSKGGSMQRKTMIRNYSDIDLYCRCEGDDSPQQVLDRTKSFLQMKYSEAGVKIDHPSVIISFNRIEVEITPYKWNSKKGKTIPINNQEWKESNFFKLKDQMKQLFGNNVQFVDAVKVLKYLNFNKRKQFRSFEIEKLIYNQFKDQTNKSLSWYIHTFLKGNPQLSKYAKKFEGLIELEKTPNSPLRKNWNKFIDGKKAFTQHL